jgi:hypothetical protein
MKKQEYLGRLYNKPTRNLTVNQLVVLCKDNEKLGRCGYLCPLHYALCMGNMTEKVFNATQAGMLKELRAQEQRVIK